MSVKRLFILAGLCAAASFAQTAEQQRTVITGLPYTIQNSGYYYLASNLSANVAQGITIKTSNVTLDLGGYTIAQSGPLAKAIGIDISGANKKNIVIRNGSLRGWTGSGISNNVDVAFGATDNGPWNYQSFDTAILISNISFVNTASSSGTNTNYGVLLFGVGSTNISNCVFTGGNTGVDVEVNYNAATATLVGQDVVVENNMFYGLQNAVVSFSYKGVFRGNYFDASTSADLYFGSTSKTHNLIENNVMIGTGKTGNVGLSIMYAQQNYYKGNRSTSHATNFAIGTGNVNGGDNIEF